MNSDIDVAIQAGEHPTFTSPFAAWRLSIYPFALSVLGGIAILVFARSWTGAAAAFALLVGGVLSASACMKAGERQVRDALTAARRSDAQAAQRALDRHLAELNELFAALTAAWIKNVDTGRVHMEGSVTELSGRFASIVEQLERSALAAQGTQSSTEEA